ncbi:ABC transporter permease [Halopenitus persicus]|uniref:Spermidine/putrescine transport system permease protein n=1 Tax=Halopenitus persicus TaxID=1048396 RepID=A0A1H3FQ06_9EURY|nr:ABC transporter permease [Halopenitus persicus]QHS16732.1 ABC transporter permease [haloarchaeon 3A1-DGR]SDX92468.1 spermidine/putrescine transport system permease protein [Halopenitus persicus]
MGRDTTREASGVDAHLVRRIRRNRWTGAVVNLAPSAFWLGVFFLAPLAVMLVFSFGQRGAFGEVLLAPEHIGLQQYREFFLPDEHSLLGGLWVTIAWVVEWALPFEVSLTSGQATPYVRLLFKSIGYGVVATVVSFVVGYPMAYYLGHLAPERYQNLLVVLVILPFWASFLVRIYAIQLLLSANSVLTNALAVLPGIGADLSLMNSRFAVLLGLVYIWIPFMILPVYASIEEIDFTYREAAMDLGADRLEAFVHVIFPLSKPGVMAGSVLVFIPSAGAYVIPELLGGTDSQMIGNLIADQFGSAGNWPLGAAASFVLMGVMLLSIAAYQRGGGELA